MRAAHRVVTGLLIGALFVAADVAAQETICDPENPACVTEDDGADESVEPDSETICDPENPACNPQTDGRTRQMPSLVEPDATSAPAATFNRARFLGGWGMQLDVDTAHEGGGEDIVEAHSRLDLGLEYEPRDDLRIVVEGQFRHWVGGKENPDATDLLVNAQDVRAAYDVRLGEAYVWWRFDDASIGLGNIITRWGSTDLTRPGDVLNPTDQTSFSAMDAAERIPQLTLDLTWAGRGWAVQGLVVPFFVPDRAWAFGRDTSLFNPRNPAIADQFPVNDLLSDLVDPSVQDDVQPVVGATRVPDEVPRNVSLGTRFTATFANTDIGFGGWRGWDRTPFIFVDDDLRALLQTVVADGQVLEDFDFLQFFIRNPGLLDLTDRISEKAVAGEELFFAEHRRLHMLLLDAARYIGPIGVRADVAAFAQKTYMTEDFRAVRRPTLAPSVGLSWERIESEDDIVTITIEGFWQKPLAADDPVTEAFVDEAERGSTDDPLLLIGDGIYGVAGAFLWSIPWIDARLQLGGVFNVSHGDVIASARLERMFLGWLNASVGYTLFEGPDPAERLTLGGLYDHNDQVTFSVSGVF